MRSETGATKVRGCVSWLLEKATEGDRKGEIRAFRGAATSEYEIRTGGLEGMEAPLLAEEMRVWDIDIL